MADTAKPTSSTMTGARAILKLDGEVKGIFNSFSYSLSYDTETCYSLGAFAPRDIVYTAQGAISCQASGWRVVDHGAHVDAHLPALQDLLTSPYITITVEDRQTGKVLCNIQQVRPTGYSTQYTQRQAQEISCTFIGITVGDESTPSMSESASAAPFPTGPDIV